MSPRSAFRNLDARDIFVLRDLVRFGALANDQIDRRYADSKRATLRLPLLVSGGLVEAWAPLIKDTRVFSATAAGARVAQAGLRSTRPSLGHLRHDIAVVDLADHLLQQHPGSEWRTEREVGRELRGSDRPVLNAGLPRGPGHKPDGLLLTDGKRLAIELEHSDKGDWRYAHICRWYALTIRIDAVRWYVDSPRIIARLVRVNAEYGFARDVDFTCEPFPQSVAIRPWVRG